MIATVITLDVIQTVGLAVLVFVVGRYIKSKVAFFQKYFIHAPVIGGPVAERLISKHMKSTASVSQ